MYVSSVEIVGNIDFGHAAQAAVVVMELVQYDRAAGALPDSPGMTAGLTPIPHNVYKPSAAHANCIPFLEGGVATSQGSQLMFSANGYQQHALKLDGACALKVGGVYNVPRSNAQLGLFVYTIAANSAGAVMLATINVTAWFVIRFRQRL